MLDVNFRNAVIVAPWVWSHVQRNNRGHFSVISSTVGLTTEPRDDEAIYAATKSAQVSFAPALGKNNTNPKIRVTLFCPGGLKINLWSNNDVEDYIFRSFLDPEKVAVKIVACMSKQTSKYEKFVSLRGSL